MPTIMQENQENLTNYSVIIDAVYKLLSNDTAGASNIALALVNSGCRDSASLSLVSLCLLAAKDRTGLIKLFEAVSADRHNLHLIEGMKDLFIHENKFVNFDNANAANNYYNFLEKISKDNNTNNSYGFDRANYPLQVELNGDLIWIYADMLPFLWHVVHKVVVNFVLRIIAETGHYDWVKQRIKPGDIVFDIGSNIGLFTTMMSTGVGDTGKVYAFEPNPPAYKDLNRILKLNQMYNVDTYEFAVSDANGMVSFNQINSGDVSREGSGIVRDSDLVTSNPQISIITVPSISLDYIVNLKNVQPTLLKIDVEGAEWFVVEGAKETLEKYKPKIVMEFHADPQGNFDHEKMHAILKQYGYNIVVEGKNYFCE